MSKGILDKQKFTISFVTLILLVLLFCHHARAAGINAHMFSALRTLDKIAEQSRENPDDIDIKTLRDFFFETNGDPKGEMVKAYVTGALIPYAMATLCPLKYPKAASESTHMYYGFTGLLYSAILSKAGESGQDTDVAMALGCINHYFVAKYTHPIINEFAGAAYGDSPAQQWVVDFDLDTGERKWKDPNTKDELLYVYPKPSVSKSRHAFFESCFDKYILQEYVTMDSSMLCLHPVYYDILDTYETARKIIKDAYVHLWGKMALSTMREDHFKDLYTLLMEYVFCSQFADLDDSPVSFPGANNMLSQHLFIPKWEVVDTFYQELEFLGFNKGTDYSHLIERFDGMLWTTAPEETIKVLLRAAPFIEDKLVSCLTVRNLRLQNVNLNTGRLVTEGDNEDYKIPELIGNINPQITKAYVTNRGDDTLRAFMLVQTGHLPASNSLSTNISSGNSIDVGFEPKAVSFDPLGKFAWVANTGDGTFSLVNPDGDQEIDIDPNDEQITRLELGMGSESLTITPEGYRLFVSDNSGSISVIDLNRRELIKTISFGGGNIKDIVASPDGKRVCATVHPNKVVVIDTALTDLDDLNSASYQTDTIYVRHNGEDAENIKGADINPEGNILYVTNNPGGKSFIYGYNLYAVDLDTKVCTPIITYVHGSKWCYVIDSELYLAPLATVSDFIGHIVEMATPPGVMIEVAYDDWSHLWALAPLGMGLMGSFIMLSPVPVYVQWVVNPLWMYQGKDVAIPALSYEGFKRSSLLYETFSYTGNLGMMDRNCLEDPENCMADSSMTNNVLLGGFIDATFNEMGTNLMDASLPLAISNKMAVSTLGDVILTNTCDNSIGFYSGRDVFEALQDINEVEDTITRVSPTGYLSFGCKRNPIDWDKTIGFNRSGSVQSLLNEPVGVDIQPMVYQVLPVQGEKLSGDVGEGGAQIDCLIFSRIPIKEVTAFVGDQELGANEIEVVKQGERMWEAVIKDTTRAPFGTNGAYNLKFEVTTENGAQVTLKNKVTIDNTGCKLKGIYIEDDIRQILPGEEAIARGWPDGLNLYWEIMDEYPEGEVKAQINPISGLIKVDDDTESGYIIIKATDTETGCFKEAMVDVGCSACSSNNNSVCRVGTVNANVGSIDFRVSLGSGYGGHSAGYIYLKVDEPSKILATPKALQFSSLDREVKARYDSAGTLRQVLTPKALVDIMVNNDFSYHLNFYRPGAITGQNNGLYTVDPSFQPFVIWRIENPDASASSYNRLKITQLIDTMNKIYEYVWDESENDWTLSKGDGLQLESRSESRDVNNDRVVTHTIKDSTNNIVFVEQTIYHEFSWGEEIIRRVIDPEGTALTTTTTYYEDPAMVGSYAKTQSQANPDGAWVRYEYDDQGRKIKEVRPWLDAAIDAPDTLARVTHYDYDSVDENDTQEPRYVWNPRTVAEEIQGILVSKTYYAYLTTEDGDRIEIVERCLDAAKTYGDPDNQRTVTVYYPSGTGTIEAGRIKSARYPDGRYDTYTFEYGTYVPDADPAACRFGPGEGRDVLETVIHGTIDHPEGIMNKTTSETSIQDEFGLELLREVFVFTGEGYDRIQWTRQYYDEDGRVVKVINSDGTQTTGTWSCCAKESETDARGITRNYVYDDLYRLETVVKEGISSETWPDQGDIFTTYTYDAAGRQLTETVSAGGLSMGTANEYDSIGRLMKTTDSAGLVTSYQYDESNLINTVIRPGGSTEITTRYTDGRIKSITGSGVVPQFYEYGVNADGTQWTKVYTGRVDSPRWKKSTTDLLGRTIKSESPGFASDQSPIPIVTNENYYNGKGQLVKTSTTGSADTLYVYDELGNQIGSWVDINHNDTLDKDVLDRVNESDTYYTLIDEHWWQESAQWVYAAENDDQATTISIQRSRITGLGVQGQVGESVSIDIHGNQMIEQVYFDRVSKTETRIGIYPDSIHNERSISVNGLLISSQDKTGMEITYSYDSLGRRTGLTDSRTGTTITHYNSKGQVEYVEDAGGNRVTYGYDPDTGQKVKETNALGKETRYAYNQQGQIVNVWGMATYPVKYEYDTYGQKNRMYTYRGGINWSEDAWPGEESGVGDVTIWYYDEATGLLSAKEDSEGKCVSYTYTPAGKLKTRTWARTEDGNALVTTYSYDGNTGELLGIDYSNETQDIIFTYDRLGRQKSITDAVGTRTFVYNSALQLESEGIDGLDELDGLYDKVITRTYDTGLVKGRLTGFALGSDYGVTYSYDDAGRFSSVGWNVSGKKGTAAYSYLQNSGLLSHYRVGSEGVTNEYITSYGYEAKRDLRTQVRNEYGAQVISQYDYVYDEVGRRRTVNNSGKAFEAVGNAFNRYGYNDRNELIESSRYLGADVSDTSVPVQSEYRGYDYDNIGNREEAVDWDEVGGNVRMSTYMANSLNQYEQQAVEGEEEANDFEYDDDGNLVSLSRGVVVTRYIYNAENRLVEVVPEVAGDGERKVEYVYDYMGRRVRKRVYRWDDAGGWVDVKETLFVYDGWNMVSEMTMDAGTGQQTIKSYIWGLDLSGSTQGAGGIGGLIAVVDEVGEGVGEVYYYAYDGNGNVGQVVGSVDGSVGAHYEYDPYGNEIVVSGDVADGNGNAFRFSTKYWDGECGLYYYGYRYYEPEVGRWLTRDHLGERAELNLYSFINNSPIVSIDLYGLLSYKKGNDDPKIKYDIGAGAYNTEPSSMRMWALKQAIMSENGVVRMSLPDAKAHLEHYLSNTAEDYTIRLQKMIDDVPNEKAIYEKEIALAMNFVQTLLYSGAYFITSGKASGGYIRSSESWNWYYAVGGYSAWGKGFATVCKGSYYTLEFEYKFADKYNWDKGKYVEIIGIKVTDEFMGKFHRMGLAKEFYMNGSIKKTIKWKHGEAPEIVDGWVSLAPLDGR